MPKDEALRRDGAQDDKNGAAPACRDGSQPSAPSGQAAGDAPARSGEHCSPWEDEATGPGAGIRDQGSGIRGGSEFRVQSSAPPVGGGVLDAPPSAAPRSDEATGNGQPATGNGGTGPSAPLRCAQDDKNGVASACRDGSQPSAPSEEATGNRQQATGQGTGNREPGIGNERTGPSAPLRCAQDDKNWAASACRDGSQPSAPSEQATGNRKPEIGDGGTDCHDQSADWSRNDIIGTVSGAPNNSQFSILNSQVPAPAREALSRLEAAGFAACLVGGCVRDSFLGRVPGDWDVTTSALPEQTETVFAGERIIETGLKHGTVTVLLEGLPLEITTFRRESGYADHRHPDAVAFTPSLEEDLARRDFTINAMAWSPARGLADPLGGRVDLEKRIIRCVGEPRARFDEDALRILRALRFAAQLDFAIDPATAEAAFALKDTLALVSRERIAAELTKLLCGPAVRRIVREYWPILALPLPELAPMAGLDQRSPYHCYDVLEHSAAAAEAVPPDRILRWAALLHDAGKPACFTLDEQGRGHFYGHAKPGAELARAALTRLRFDKDTVRRVAALVELHDYPIDPPVEPAEQGSGIRDQGSGDGGGSEFRVQSSAPPVGGGVLDAPPSAVSRSDEAAGQGSGIKDQGSGDGGGSEFRVQSSASPVGGGVLRSEASPLGDAPPSAAADRAIKKLLGRLGEEDFFRLLALKRADALAHHPDYRGRAAVCERFAARARELLAQKAPFSRKDLAVNGTDLLELGIPGGPGLGEALDELLEAVLSGALPNEREALLEAARRRPRLDLGGGKA